MLFEKGVGRFAADESKDPKFEEDRIGEQNKGLTRLIKDTCMIFEEITGMPADPLREGGAVAHWARKGWQIFDLKLVIEFEFRNERSKKYYEENPMRFNLRGFLNASGEREGLLIDLHHALKHRANMKESKEQLHDSSSELNFLLFQCGAKIPAGDRDAYNEHLNVCFDRRGFCFFPASIGSF